MPDSKKIGGLTVQRAEITRYGRRWTAWFTTEIPFSDGPFTFHGLPGMILNLQDATQTHAITLKGIKKLAGAYTVPPTLRKRMNNATPVNYSQYKKAFITDRNNPNLQIKQHLAAGGVIKMVDENGKEMDVQQYLRDADRKIKETNAKNNNPMNLDLLR